MPAATITLKVPVERKNALMARAKREKKSLNAYILERIDAPRPPLAGVIDRHAGVVRSGRGDLSTREGLGA
jgi:hypothetical protein